jgi:transposase-like protein
MSETNTRRTFTKAFKLGVIEQSEHCKNIKELAGVLGL